MKFEVKEITWVAGIVTKDLDIFDSQAQSVFFRGLVSPERGGSTPKHLGHLTRNPLCLALVISGHAVIGIDVSFCSEIVGGKLGDGNSVRMREVDNSHLLLSAGMRLRGRDVR